MRSSRVQPVVGLLGQQWSRSPLVAELDFSFLVFRGSSRVYREVGPGVLAPTPRRTERLICHSMIVLIKKGRMSRCVVN